MKNKTAFFTNLKSFMLISTFFSLWFAVYFQHEIEDMVAYFLILSIGIIHGTNDMKLIQKTTNITGKKRFLKVLSIYVGFIILGVLFFYFLPLPALLLFILFSAYHFGEQHWSSRIKDLKLSAKLFFMCYGLIVLLILFLVNYDEVAIIVQNIVEFTITKNIYIYTLLISSFLFLALGYSLNLHRKTISIIIEELFYILVFFIVFKTASLLWAFAIYFIFWHSIPSLIDQVIFLYGDYKKEHVFKYLKSSFLYWIVSLVGMFILYWIFKGQDRLFLSIFFTLIATITFPHVWVMSKLNK